MSLSALFLLIIFKAYSKGSPLSFKKDFEEKTVNQNPVIIKDQTPKEVEAPVEAKNAEKQTAKKTVESVGLKSAKNQTPKKATAPVELKDNKDQTPKPVAASIGPKNTEVAAKKPIEKKEKSNRANGTRGHYVGISGNLNQLKFHEEYTMDGTPYKAKVKPSATGYGYGVGLNYKHAFNFNGFFIAPGAFVEKNRNSQVGNGRVYSAYNQVVRLDIDGRYGLTADLGYDFTEKFSTYLMGGYSIINYTAKNGLNINGLGYQTTLKNSSKGSAIVGLGAKYNYNNHISFNIEANTQTLNLKTNTDVPYNRDNNFMYEANYRGRFNAVKIGVSYNF